VGPYIPASTAGAVAPTRKPSFTLKDLHMTAIGTPITLSMFSTDPSNPLNDLRMPERSRPLNEHVKRFIAQTGSPMAKAIGGRLARVYAMQRTPRLADGPDKLHHRVVGRQEIGHHQSLGDALNSAMAWRN
jgi:hypothetical protein